MRTIGLLLAAALQAAQAATPAQAPPVAAPPAQSAPAQPAQPTTPTGPPPTRAVASMSEMMIKILYPFGDAVFYIESRTPKTDAEWGELEVKTLMLAESGNLLMLPGYARDQGRWMDDSKLLLEAGTKAYRAAKRKDVAALVEVNDALYQSCVVCHQHYRPNYGRGRGRGLP